jgi:hypothetical protein
MDCYRRYSTHNKFRVWHVLKAEDYGLQEGKNRFQCDYITLQILEGTDSACVVFNLVGVSDIYLLSS